MRRERVGEMSGYSSGRERVCACVCGRERRVGGGEGEKVREWGGQEKLRVGGKAKEEERKWKGETE